MSVDRAWKRGRTKRPQGVAKNLTGFRFGKSLFSGHSRIVEDGGQNLMIMASIIPGHPRRWIVFQFARVPLDLNQVVESIDACKLAGMNQAHEQIPYFGTV